MTKLHILKVPNSILEKPCEKVQRFDNELHKLLDDMTATMQDANGAGIAAPQVGISQQICVVEDDEYQTGIYELINPIILENSGSNYDVEGCLSIPDVYGYVTRAEMIKVSAQDRNGEAFELVAEGYFARAILHEVDHLNGILFTEKIEKRISLEELLDLQVKETRIVFMGTPDFSVLILEELIANGFDIVAVVTQPDRPVGRKRVLTAPPVKVAALKYGIPVIQPEKIRNPVELEKLFAFEPELIVTAAFGQILPNDLLDYPAYGCINVHASLLPELRGGAPIHSAIMQGKQNTGVTIMYMAEKLDAGDIISVVEVPIDENDHTGSLHEKLSIAGAQLLLETLPKIIQEEIEPIQQDELKATFARNISREQELIDWTKSGEKIYNQIRGLHPWPVAYTLHHGEVIKVWWGEKHKTSVKAKPGEIIGIEADGIVVHTGNEVAIKITDLQLAGKKRVDAAVLLRSGHPFVVGEILGTL